MELVLWYLNKEKNLLSSLLDNESFAPLLHRQIELIYLLEHLSPLTMINALTA